jgi:N4-gp56 family major capsid protein
MPPTQTTTQGSLAPEFKQFYDRTLLERALPELVHAQFGQRRPIPRGSGKTIEFRRFSALPVSLTPLTEGVTPTGNSLNVTAITAAVNQFGDYVEGSDLLDLTAIDPILTETSQLLGEQSGYSVDTIVRDILNAGTNVQYANNRASRVTVAAGDVLTVAEIRKAVRTLKKNRARPVAGQYFVAFVSPSATYDLQSDPNWTRASEYAGSEQIYSGEVGRLYGVRFIETTETKVYAGAGAAGIDVHATLAIGANAYGIVPLDGQNLETFFKPVGSSGTADPLNQRWTMGWKTAFTAKILNDAFLLRIEHAVSA